MGTFFLDEYLYLEPRYSLVCLEPAEVKRGHRVPCGELQMVEICHYGAGKPTWVIQESSWRS